MELPTDEGLAYLLKMVEASGDRDAFRTLGQMFGGMSMLHVAVMVLKEHELLDEFVQAAQAVHDSVEAESLDEDQLH
jgi:hypothetical protein